MTTRVKVTMKMALVVSSRWGASATLHYWMRWWRAFPEWTLTVKERGLLAERRHGVASRGADVEEVLCGVCLRDWCAVVQVPRNMLLR